MGREEQIEEREVLDSIFPDEITDFSEASYGVSIALDVPVQDEDAEAPTILLTVDYPPKYPDTAPTLDIAHAPNAPKCPHLHFPSDTPDLLSTLTSTISESLGQAMIFTLISTLKESAENLITQRLDAEQAVRDKEAQRAEEKENAKFHGEAVTRESFLKWRMKFREEEEREEGERRGREEEGRGRKVGKGEEVKMSGRELWERGLVGRVEEEEGEEDALGGMEGLRVAE